MWKLVALSFISLCFISFYGAFQKTEDNDIDMAMTQNEIILGYWNMRGLGHPIRFLLKYLELEFTDKRYTLTENLTYDNWYADREKLNLDFPNLPYLLDGNTKVTESRAILKYLCRTRKPELLGKTIDVETRLDMVDNFIYDLWYIEFIGMLYQYTEERHKDYKTLELRKLGYLSDFMKDNKWVTGDDLTYIDFLMYEVLYQMQVFDSKCLDKFGNLKRFVTKFEELHLIKRYMNDPNFLKAPLYSALAIYKI